MIPTRFRPLLLALLMIALTLLFFRQLAFSEMILARGDTYVYFYPYWDARNDAFRAFELPLWSPDLFMGTPLLANPQLGSYYPLNWLTAPLRAPDAIKISILLHSALAGMGMVFLYRQVAGERLLPALTAAAIYAFSGPLGAHVEQINQFQGLAWLPILFGLYHRLLTGRNPWRDGLLLGLAWALQIYCGHTQTVFISGLGLGAYGLGLALSGGNAQKSLARAWLLLAAAVVMALLLSLPQLLPSLELAGMSNRGGGFAPQDAIAFSLPPNMLGRALLPSYDGQIFGEYVAYLGIIGLGLALWGMICGGRRRWIWMALAGLGIALALGRYNPLYLLLAELPGFNLFRVPARFLALYGLAMALLSGMGVEALLPQAGQARPDKRRVAAVAIVIGALILLTRFVLQPDPGLIFGASTISHGSLALWILALLGVIALLLRRHRLLPALAFILAALELLLAAEKMPYNDLAPSEVYLGQRFTISHMLAANAEDIAPGRTLSISPRYFDPGDIGELRARYDRLSLAYESQFHALDAVKMQETLMPNLALTWGIPSVDGFGGGITPSRQYALFSSLLLPEGRARAVDGRLGERMTLTECRSACIPDLRWLQRTDTRWVITDKVYDIWHEGIAYDTGLWRFWSDVDHFEFPSDAYDQARILHSDPLEGDSDAIQLPHGLLLTITDEAGLGRILAGRHSILAVSLARSHSDKVFLEAQPPPWQRVLSSAIKVYRVPGADRRAYLAQNTIIVPDDQSGYERALQELRSGDLDVIHGDSLQPRQLADGDSGGVQVVEYGATQIALRVSSPTPAWLILADSYYPGWTSTVNGRPTPIARANIVFRALPVPAGDSEVIFRFQPDLWRAALYGGLLAWAIALVAMVALWRRGRSGFAQ